MTLYNSKMKWRHKTDIILKLLHQSYFKNCILNLSFLDAHRLKPSILHHDHSTLHVNIALNLKFTVHRKSSVNVTQFYSIAFFVWLETQQEDNVLHWIICGETGTDNKRDCFIKWEHKSDGSRDPASVVIPAGCKSFESTEGFTWMGVSSLK